jgi:hypothetical protein
LTLPAQSGEESSGEAAMTIHWFSDEDRRRMLDEERVMRLWREFMREWMLEHFPEASREPLTPERLQMFDRLPLRPYDDEH